jgi:hypothetical protein
VQSESSVVVAEGRKQFRNPGRRIPPLEAGTRGLSWDRRRRGLSAYFSELQTVRNTDRLCEIAVALYKLHFLELARPSL